MGPAPAPPPLPCPPQVPPPALWTRRSQRQCSQEGFAWFPPGARGSATSNGARCLGRHQNNRALFLRSFLFQRARRSNSSTLIPNTSWNSSGDKCLFREKGKSRGQRSVTAQHATGPPEAARLFGLLVASCPPGAPAARAFPLCRWQPRARGLGGGPSVPTQASPAGNRGHGTPGTRTPPAWEQLGPGFAHMLSS